MRADGADPAASSGPRRPEPLAAVERAFRAVPAVTEPGPGASAAPEASDAADASPAPAPAAWAGSADRRRRAAEIGVRSRGPAVRPPPPSLAGPLRAGLALIRLPLDLVVALEYVVQQLPYLVQDVRSLVNSLSRLAHDADPGTLADVIAGLAAAVDPRDGALIRALDAAAELARAQAREIDARRLAEGREQGNPRGDGNGDGSHEARRARG